MSISNLPLIEPQVEYKTSRRQSVLSNYDPSAFPADIQFAKLHGKSQNIGQYIPPKDDVERCPCCLSAIYKPQLPINCNLREILHLGSAFPLYFYFIKQCIILVSINILICSLPSLIINLTKGNMCVVLDGAAHSLSNLICKSSVINIMNVEQIDLLQIQSGLNIGAIFISIIVVGILDIKMTEQYENYRQSYDILPQASDYSVLIQGLPRDITVSQIQQFVVQKIKQKGYYDQRLQKIYLIFNLRTYYSLYSNKRQILQEINVKTKYLQEVSEDLDKLDGNQPLSERTKLTKNKKQTMQIISELQNKKQLIQIQINNYEEIFKIAINRITRQQPIDLKLSDKEIIQQEVICQLKQKDQRSFNHKLSFSGKCIVTLNSSLAKDALTAQTKNLYFIQKLGYQIGQCLGESHSSIVILDAPQPGEIVFSNIGCQKRKVLRDRVLITLGLFSIIALDFVILTLQKKFVKEQKASYSSSLIFSLINSQLIALMNSIVSRIIRVTENKTQMHSTQTSYYYSVTSKLIVLYLINMLVTTFFSNLVNYYLINQNSRSLDNRFPLNFQEFLFDIFFLLITNPFTSFFLIFFDHRQIYKLFRRFMIERRNQSVTQAEANLYYENMDIDLSNKYSNIYRFILFSAGTCFIYPPAFMICAFTISIFYWEDKYLLLRRYVIPHKLDFILTRKMQKIMWMFPMMMAITNLIIMFVPISDGKAFEEGKYSKAYYYLSIIALLCSIVIYLGGCNWVISGLRLLIKKKDVEERKVPDYKDIELDFEEDYWHHYPYFKFSKKKQDRQASSPTRKQKIVEMKRKMGMDVFTVIKNHLHHERYSPIV